MSELHQGLACFACDVLPKGEEGGFDDLAMTTWQFGCMALIAMGVAEETPSGCSLLVSEDQLEKAIRPEGLWMQDAVLVLLKLARQTGDLVVEYPATAAESSSTARLDQFVITPVGGMEAYRKSLQAATCSSDLPDSQRKLFELQIEALGKAEARIPVMADNATLFMMPWLIDLLEGAGFLKQGHWNEADVLLRLWVYKLSEEHLFDWARQALREMPEDLRAVHDSLRRDPTPAELETYQQGHEAHHRQRMEQFLEAGFPDPSQLVPERSQEEKERAARVGWRNKIRHEMICAMESRWRPLLGWDSGEALLPLFHDRVVEAVVQYWEAA
ncbi:MAG: hypothetical protein JXQ89_10790 [Pelagimonas sp.]